MAQQGVWFFFVLSGFLITHLLLNEIQGSGGISLADFYIRRVLRIWPIYYLMVAVALVVVAPMGVTVASHFTVADSDFWPRLALYVFFLPQLATHWYPHVIGASHLWSIGVEEMFYLVWPVILLRCWKRIYIAVVPIMFLALFGESHYAPQWLRVICVNLDLKSFFFLGVGASGAWIARYHPAVLRALFSDVVQGAGYLLVGVNLAFNLLYGKFMMPVYALSFLVVIMNVSMNPKTWFGFEHRTLKFLGDCSYGIYVYQFLWILAVVEVMEALDIRNLALLYIGSVVVTLAVAALSYRFFEKPFLDLRRRFRREPISARAAM